MEQEDIAFLGVTEAKLTNNDPPNFNDHVHSKGGGYYPFQNEVPGTRGLLWLVSPSWHQAASALPQSSPNFAWLRVECPAKLVYICLVYLGRNDATDVAQSLYAANRIVSDARGFDPNAVVIICGDMNADPFTNAQSPLRAALNHLLDSFVLVARPSNKHVTRLQSGSHIDVFMVSRPALPLIHEHLRYFNILDDHNQSDHLALLLQLGLRPRRRSSHKRIIKPDTSVLHSDPSLYRSSFPRLCRAWCSWRSNLLLLARQRQLLPMQLIRLEWYGLVYLLDAATALTLPSKIVRPRRSAICLSTLPAPSAPALGWKHVSKQLSAAEPVVTCSAPLDEQVRYSKVLFSGKPYAGNPKFRSHISASARVLKQQSASPITPDESIPLLMGLAKKLKDNVASGPDSIQPELLKHAHENFWTSVAVFLQDASTLNLFPPEVVDGFFQLIYKRKNKPKHLLKSFRHVRMTSVLGKLIERVVANRIFPIHADYQPLICPEQLAGRRHHSSDMLAVVLAVIISVWRGNLLLLFADAESAFDTVWREALWVKLASAHGNEGDVALLMALYDKLRSAIRHEDALSAWLEFLKGIGQGSPNSTALWNFLISDLPRLLRQQGIGLKLFGLLISCLLFLDDFCVPLSSAAQVQVALDTMNNFASKWDIAISPAKTKVVCIRYNQPIQHSWKLGQHDIPIVDLETYLSVRFTSSCSWKKHFDNKLASARSLFFKLKNAGVLGGHNPIPLSLQVVQAKIWAKIDTGRVATMALRPSAEYRQILLKLDTFFLSVLRAVLSVSRTASSDGVIGELGTIPDNWRGLLRALTTFSRMLATPASSFVSQFIQGAINAAPDCPFIRLILRTCTCLGLALTQRSTSRRWREKAKAKVRAQAAREWADRVVLQPNLLLAYGPQPVFMLRPYLKGAAFRGRQLLTKLRINDLNLKATSYTSDASVICPLCGTAPETRTHFVLHCPSLANTRRAYAALIAPLRDRSASDALNMRIICQSTPGDAPAHVVGNFLADLWFTRTSPHSPLAPGGPLYLPYS